MVGPSSGSASDFGQKTVSKISDEQRQEALYTGQLNPTIQRHYSIALFDQELGTIIQQEGLDPVPGRSRFVEYFFTVPPRSIDVSEPYSTTIVPTQRGGKFIESHGSILKNIRVQGTTGLRANPQLKKFDTVPIFGSALNALSDNFDVLSGQGFFEDRVLDPKEATGFDDIVYLRNIFRHYSDVKERENNARSLLMLWRNAKESEYWVVEPLEFSLRQSSSSPLTYEYVLNFRTLSKFSTVINKLEDPLKNVLAVNKFFARVQEYNQALKSTFLILSTQIKRLESLGIFAATQLLSPIINVMQGLNALRSTTGNVGSRARTHIQQLIANVDDALDKLQNTGAAQLDTQDRLLNSLLRLKVLGAKMIVEPSISETVSSESTNRRRRSVGAYTKGGTEFNQSRQAPSTGGSSSFLGNEAPNSNIAQGTVHNGEDIRDLAGRLLGDRGRWQILVTLNGLKPPYVAPTARDGVLGYGSSILYPSKTRGANSLSVTATTTTDNEGQDYKLGPLQQAYGRDLRLTSVDDTIAGEVYTDLSVNQRGDISTVVGIPNVEQALKSKFATKKGELPAHPNFGAKFPIGRKLTSYSINDFYIQSEATIYSDERIRDINTLTFKAVGDTLVMSAVLTLTDESDSINTSFAVNRI